MQKFMFMLGKATIIIFLILISFVGVVFSQGLKPWSAKPADRITWGDFKETPPDPLPKDKNGNDIPAEIWVGHDVTPWTGPPGIPIENPAGTFTCTVTITGGLSATTVMDPNQSWVAPGADNEDLNHEKGHFDLAEKFRRKLQKQLDDLKPPKGKTYTGTSSGPGASGAAACANATALAQADVDAVLAEKKAQFDKLQDDYDNDTDHGTDEDEQKKWKTDINNELVALGFSGFKDSDYTVETLPPDFIGPPRIIPTPDGIPDVDDNCPDDPNLCQMDSDDNGIGDVCQADSDLDGVTDTVEARFASDASDDSSTPEVIGFNKWVCWDGRDNDKNGFIDGADLKCQNTDTDLVSDFFDNCISTYNPEQEDANSNGIGDICDPDDDSDSILDEVDNCPLVYNPCQHDTDEDGIGDACDWDLDGDGWDQLCIDGFCALSFDNCPFTYNPDQTDSDGDGIGDACYFSQADFGHDGDVDWADLSVFVASWLKREGEPGYDTRCDFYDDGIVNFKDYAVFANEWNPIPPEGLLAQAVSSSQINLVWEDTTDGENGFKIERKTDETGTYGQIASVGENAVTYSDSGLEAGTTYYYRVYAYKSVSGFGSSGYSNEASDTTNSSPIMESIDDKTVKKGQLLEFTVLGYDPDNDTLIYSAEGLPEGATFTNQTFSWRPTYEQIGEHLVTFTVSDGKLTDSETINIEVTAPLPNIRTINPRAGFSGTYLRVLGKDFGPRLASSRVNFATQGESKDAQIISWRENNIICKVPQLKNDTYEVRVINLAGESNPEQFRILRKQHGPFPWFRWGW